MLTITLFFMEFFHYKNHNGWHDKHDYRVFYPYNHEISINFFRVTYCKSKSYYRYGQADKKLISIRFLLVYLIINKPINAAAIDTAIKCGNPNFNKVENESFSDTYAEGDGDTEYTI